MRTLLLVLAVTQPPPDRLVYFPGSIWHQRVELKATEKIALVGHSAGAHSAAMLAFDPANKGRIRKVTLLSGVYRVGLGVRLVNLGPWNKPYMAFRGIPTQDASPLYNVPPAEPDSPVFEIYYASRDLPGLRMQSEAFYRALIAQGYTATLHEVPATHMSIPGALGY